MTLRRHQHMDPSLSMRYSEPEDSTALQEICKILLRFTGHDFSAYKKSTVARRIERRIQANLLLNREAYVSFLENDPREAKALLKDLLISVTQFFRNPESFITVKDTIIPRLFENKRPGEAVRVWIPACATGEEAYTFAILLKQYQQKIKNPIPVQIFATDIDSPALEFARAGFYPASMAKKIPVEYLNTYFKKSNRGYQAGPELREPCVFSEHSLLKNPPFSKIDFISCRNLFIYWEPELQSKILPIFHYALNPNGYLLLGPAESVTGTESLFRTIDKKHRIFQRTDATSRDHLLFPLTHPSKRENVILNAKSTIQASSERDMTKTIGAHLLEDFAPPAFVINEMGEVLFYSGKTGKYLEPPTGAPSNNIFDLIRRPVRPDLHALVHRAIKSKTEVFHPDLTFENDGEVQKIKVTVRPMPEPQDGSRIYLIVLQALMTPKTKEQAASEGIAISTTDVVVQQLESELRDTREYLQTTIEQVKSSNEELLSMNEELHSANEELQTSKEELQSTNEELETVNSELSQKVDELDSTNSDLQNFFNSAQIPILFLDRKFRIQRFTPAATLVYRLIPTDVGRKLSDIASDLECHDFTPEFHQVLNTLQPVERAVSSRDHKLHFLLKVSPYCTINNVIDGVVVTFLDVTELRIAQEITTKSYEELIDVLESMSDAFFSIDQNWIITRVNEAHVKSTHFARQDQIGKNLLDLFFSMPEAKTSRYWLSYHKVMTERVPAEFEEYYPPFDLWTQVRAYPKIDGGIAVFFTDVTQQKKINLQIEAERGKFRQLADSLPQIVWTAKPDGYLDYYNERWYEFTGFNRAEGGDTSWLPLLHPDDIEPSRDQWYDCVKTGKRFQIELRFKDFQSNKYLWFMGMAVPIRNERNEIIKWFGSCTDISQQKNPEREAELARQELHNFLVQAPIGIALLKGPNHIYTFLNPSFLSLLFNKRPESDFLGKSVRKALPELEGQGFYEILDEVYRTGKPFVGSKLRASMAQADGKEKELYINFTYQAKRNTEGKIDGILAVIYEVTDQVNKQKEIENLANNLRLAIISRDTFVGIASHELNTPLTSLKLHTQMNKRLFARLGMAAFTPERIEKLFDNTISQAERLARLVNDMLDVSRISSGKLTMNFSFEDLSKLVVEILERFSAQLELANCPLTMEVESDICLPFDASRIDQVLTNFITNAIKYAPGKPVHVTVKKRANLAQVNIRDEGQGIDPAHQERIFGRFERATSATEVSGLGLGLFICKEIILQHRGHIYVSSEPGKGSTFTFELPLK